MAGKYGSFPAEMQKNHLENVMQCLKYHHLESGNILKPVKTSRCGRLQACRFVLPKNDEGKPRGAVAKFALEVLSWLVVWNIENNHPI